MSFFKKTATNPSGTVINFTEQDHRYWTVLPLKDELNQNVEIGFISATTFLKQFSPPFDEATMAAKTAEKRGVEVDFILREWAHNRDTACAFGTRVHAIAEDCLNGKAPRFMPAHDKEKKTFRVAWDAATKFQSMMRVTCTEQIIFHMDARIAGTIDFCLMDADGTIWIMDWKTNKEITLTNAWGKKMLKPIEHLDDCEAVKYGLQLSLYEFIMRSEKYIAHGTNVRRAIVHLTEEGHNVIELPDYSREIADLVIYKAHTPPF